MAKQFQDCWQITDVEYTYSEWGNLPFKVNVRLQSKQSHRIERLNAPMSLEGMKALKESLERGIARGEMKRIDQAKKDARKWMERSLWASSVQMPEEADSCRKEAYKGLAAVEYGNPDSFCESVRDEWLESEAAKVKEEKDRLLIALNAVKQEK